MEIRPVWAQAPGSLPRADGVAQTLPLLSQPSFTADDPFAAYLLSLTDPGSIALAAILKAATPGPGAPARMAAAGTAAVAASALGAAVQTQAGAAAALSAAAGAGAGPADLLAFAQAFGTAAAAAGTNPSDLVAGSAPASPYAPANPYADAIAAETARSDSQAAAQANATSAALAADRIAADQAAVLAGEASTNAFYAARSADDMAQGAAGLAVDATAKFMGAGTLARTAGADPEASQAASTYQSVLESVPAVDRAPSFPSLGAQAQSSPQNRAGSRPAPPAVPPPAVPAPHESLHLDLVG
ncbi:MAG: hypothetical protein ABSH53_02425 [Holophaga sp.]|jgi:hypothetical protein